MPNISQIADSIAGTRARVPKVNIPGSRGGQRSMPTSYDDNNSQLGEAIGGLMGTLIAKKMKEKKDEKEKSRLFHEQVIKINGLEDVSEQEALNWYFKIRGVDKQKNKDKIMDEALMWVKNYQNLANEMGLVNEDGTFDILSEQQVLEHAKKKGAATGQVAGQFATQPMRHSMAKDDAAVQLGIDQQYSRGMRPELAATEGAKTAAIGKAQNQAYREATPDVINREEQLGDVRSKDKVDVMQETVKANEQAQIRLQNDRADLDERKLRMQQKHDTLKHTKEMTLEWRKEVNDLRKEQAKISLGERELNERYTAGKTPAELNSLYSNLRASLKAMGFDDLTIRRDDTEKINIIREQASELGLEASFTTIEDNKFFQDMIAPVFSSPGMGTFELGKRFKIEEKDFKVPEEVREKFDKNVEKYKGEFTPKEIYEAMVESGDINISKETKTKEPEKKPAKEPVEYKSPIDKKVEDRMQFLLNNKVGYDKMTSQELYNEAYMQLRREEEDFGGVDEFVTEFSRKKAEVANKYKAKQNR